MHGFPSDEDGSSRWDPVPSKSVPLLEWDVGIALDGRGLGPFRVGFVSGDVVVGPLYHAQVIPIVDLGYDVIGVKCGSHGLRFEMGNFPDPVGGEDGKDIPQEE